MKRNVIYILLLLVFFMGSCKKEDVAKKYDLGAEVYVPAKTYTTLDNSVLLKVGPVYNVTSVDVTHMGGLLTDGKTAFTVTTPALGTIAVVDGAGQLSVTEAAMGMTKVGMKSTIRFTAIAADGTPINRDITVSVVTPFTITMPFKPIVQFDEPIGLKYKVAPANQAITSITVQKKTNYTGTYVDVPDTYAAKDSVMLNGKDYLPGDTIWVNITASTAAHTVSKLTKVVVGYYEFKHTATAKLTPTTTTLIKTSFYDLVKRRYIVNADVAAMGDSIDIEFTQTNIPGFPGNFTMGFTAPENAQFVKVPGTVDDMAEVFGNGDIVATKATDFSAAVTSFDNVLTGDVYIYRTFRGVGAYSYGMFQVSSVVKPEGVAEDSYIVLDIKN